MDHWGTLALTSAHEDTCPFIAPLFYLFIYLFIYLFVCFLNPGKDQRGDQRFCFVLICRSYLFVIPYQKLSYITENTSDLITVIKSIVNFMSYWQEFIYAGFTRFKTRLVRSNKIVLNKNQSIIYMDNISPLVRYRLKIKVNGLQADL